MLERFGNFKAIRHLVEQKKCWNRGTERIGHDGLYLGCAPPINTALALKKNKSWAVLLEKDPRTLGNPMVFNLTAKAMMRRGVGALIP